MNIALIDTGDAQVLRIATRRSLHVCYSPPREQVLTHPLEEKLCILPKILSLSFLGTLRQGYLIQKMSEALSRFGHFIWKLIMCSVRIFEIFVFV